MEVLNLSPPPESSPLPSPKRLRAGRGEELFFGSIGVITFLMLRMRERFLLLFMEPNDSRHNLRRIQLDDNVRFDNANASVFNHPYCFFKGF